MPKNFTNPRGYDRAHDYEAGAETWNGYTTRRNLSRYARGDTNTFGYSYVHGAGRSVPYPLEQRRSVRSERMDMRQERLLRLADHDYKSAVKAFEQARARLEQVSQEYSQIRNGDAQGLQGQGLGMTIAQQEEMIGRAYEKCQRADQALQDKQANVDTAYQKCMDLRTQFGYQ